MAANKTACNNVWVLDIEKGIIIPESRAYTEQTPQSINTGNSLFQLAADLVPVPGCADGNCASSDCPLGREISYLSIINSARFGGDETPNFGMSLIAATFIDNENVTPQVAAYEVEFQDGVSGFVGVHVGDTLSYDVSGLADGQYTGTIRETNSGATLRFWYGVASGLVAGFMELRETELSINLSCDLYPGYTFTVEDHATIAGNDDYTFTGSEIKILGQIVNSETYAGAEDYTETADLETDLEAPASDNIFAYHTYSKTLTEIENKSILRTKCKSS